MARNVFDEDDNSWGEPESKSMWDLDEDDNLQEESRSLKFNFKLNPKIAAISVASILGIAVLGSVVPGLLGGSEEPKPEPTAVQTSVAPVSVDVDLYSKPALLQSFIDINKIDTLSNIAKQFQDYIKGLLMEYTKPETNKFKLDREIVIIFTSDKKNIMGITSEKINGLLIEVSITSSNLKTATYNTEEKTLMVEFNNGAIYEYNKVPWNKFTKFRMAESQGKHFNENIARSHNYKKL